MQEKLAKLSVREREVLKGILDGHPSKEIARDLNLSLKSIEVYRSKLMAKMRVQSIACLIKDVLCCPSPDCLRSACVRGSWVTSRT